MFTLDLLYSYLGSLLGMFILYNLVELAVGLVLKGKNRSYLSLLLSALIVVCITYFTMGIIDGIILYFPTLIICFIFDIFVFSKRIKQKSQKEIQDNSYTGKR